MVTRLNAFLERYAADLATRDNQRRRQVRHVGYVSLANAVRMEKIP
jgi:hypothetical protein